MAKKRKRLALGKDFVGWQWLGPRGLRGPIWPTKSQCKSHALWHVPDRDLPGAAVRVTTVAVNVHDEAATKEE